METEISYSKMKKLFPNEVAEVMSKLRKSSSKEKKAKESSLTWSFDWRQQIKGMSFDEMLKSIGQPKPKKTVEQKLKELRKSLLISVKGQKNRWIGFSKQINVIPDEVLEFYKSSYQEQEDEEKRIENLTEEQREKELEEDLKELRKYPGFVEITINSKLPKV